ncbi:MAG: cyclic nucleotide-binding domain-containing protein [Phototrophicales bacterium]|nr:cyclic nucleotide-binding domain-containing protein [Phototrophicales bacterium]
MVTPIQAKQFLTDIFPQAPTDTIDLLFNHSKINTYPAGMYLCTEGKVEETFYVILSGRVDVFRTKEGKRFILDYQGAGSGFGEIALILDMPRTADVVTTEETTVLEISRADFDQFIKHNSQALLRVVQLIMQRILTQQERRLTELVKETK